jgi:hypothetical protein
MAKGQRAKGKGQRSSGCNNNWFKRRHRIDTYDPLDVHLASSRFDRTTRRPRLNDGVIPWHERRKARKEGRGGE